MDWHTWFHSPSDGAWEAVAATAPGPDGRLPLTPAMMRDWASGELFGLSQNVGMGWMPDRVLAPPVLILSTQGGLKGADGSPVALGYHTGHWEVDRLVGAAARTLAELGALPFAAAVTDPCDGRSQGTAGMFDSLPYRNDAAMVLRRLIRSLPQRRGVMGVATCDKGLPAMMMALASLDTTPGVLVPGGTTLMAETGEDAGKVQTIGVRFSRGELSLLEAQEVACRACASPGGGCQFLGTAATAQIVGEALGIAIPHSALIPSGQPIWEAMAAHTAATLWQAIQSRRTMRDILTPTAIENAMVVHAAFGGSTNFLLHLPAIAHSAGLPVPSVDDWRRVNQAVPRLVSVLPNGPEMYPTTYVYLAGGVPEVLCQLRRLGLWRGEAMTVAGASWNTVLDEWEASERRATLRRKLKEQYGVEPDRVISDATKARARGMYGTLTFPRGNLAPEGAVVKSTAIDPTVVDATGVYRHRGPARVFTSESAAMRALKAGRIQAGDVVVLIGCGPLGTGMEETYQVTAALRYLSFGKHVAFLTDARFSGVSTGACIGHISPEGLAGGPLGKLRDDDMIEIVIDVCRQVGTVNFVGTRDQPLTPDEGAMVLAERTPHPDMAPDPQLPDDTRLWAVLQTLSGGPWAGAVYDVDNIVSALSKSLRDQLARGPS
ncbi:MAG: YjhG/YagF family D-xylonate dehydratase [Firmicutes bacterium]|nr:YjhG/YagF family D-xylonate dehydratase [Bacillota bacterium]